MRNLSSQPATPPNALGNGPSIASAPATTAPSRMLGACVMQRSGEPALAVALHDVEPGTFERCALIRDWLSDLGVDRVTLLVIPARDLHPLADRSPAIAEWLIERQRAGDAVAQHGFEHPGRCARRLRPRLTNEAPYAHRRLRAAGSVLRPGAGSR